MAPARWWRRRSLRARLTLLSTLLLFVGLTVSGVALAAFFASSRIDALDAAARTQAEQLAALVDAGQLPEPLPVQTGQTAQVLNAEGGVLAASPNSTRTLALIPPDRLRTAADGHPHTGQPVTLEGQGDARLLTIPTRYAGGTAYVVLASSLDDVDATEHSLGRVEFAALPVLLFAMGGTAWLLLGSALRTVAQLSAAAAAVEPVSSGRLPVPDSRDEIRELAVTLNDMLDRLAAAASRERAFVDDAAHELRTPLASARLQLEVAAHRPAGQDWPAVVAETVTDLERLSALVEDLLVLARLDAPGSARLELVDLADLAGLDQDPVWVLGDRPALARAVTNLTANARRHARSTVLVSVRTEPGAGRVRVAVDDDGPGIPSAERLRVFDRFTRVDDARAQDSGGTGLGLAIVAAIAKGHGGEVFAGDSPLGGASVGFVLPAHIVPVGPGASPASQVASPHR